MADEGGGSKNPLLTVLVLVNTLVTGGVAFLQFQAHQREAARPSVEQIVSAQLKESLPDESIENTGEAIESEGALLRLEPFTVNLAQGDGPRRYLRLTAVLKFSKESKEEEYKSRMPQIRDAVINTVNTKRPEDILKVEGKGFLKEEIKASINAFLIDGSIVDIYYVGFQIN